MRSPQIPDASTLDRLSKRERAVLNLAVAGNIDEQIAQALGLSVSTVNSYWVRIRGKLGQLSRTELVGNLLRQQAVERQAELEAENARMGEGNAVLWRNLAQARSEIAALRGIAWHLLALDRLPEAVFVTLEDGTIEYANVEAHRLLGAEPSELEGLSIGEVTAHSEPGSGRETSKAPALPEGAERVVMGIESPCYALRRDGTNFRIVYTAERLQTATDPIVVATVRPFLQDMEALVEVLRRPFNVL